MTRSGVNRETANLIANDIIQILDRDGDLKDFEHSRLENLDKGYADLISRAMMNLRDSALGF